MTVESEVIVAPAAAGEERHSYIDWPAIIGGIALASAISLVLLAFGSAVGLGMTSFRAGEGVSPIVIAIVAGSWLLWVQISSFMAGGYLAGRMRRRAYDATEHESDIRDGVHGLLVWAGCLVVGAVIAAGGVSGLATAVGGALSTATVSASQLADEAGDPTAYFADALLRPGNAQAQPVPEERRGEVVRILVQGAASGEVAQEDRAYLAQVVSSATGLSPEESQARVDQVMTEVDNARAEALQVAEETRKWTVLAAFLTAASLLISAVGAYWAAMKGGNHRDDQTVFAGFGRF
jgi:FtsH-binding integral membrane protein